ncbi:MAG: ABC transporter permease [Dehalococcoidia bacterium]
MSSRPFGFGRFIRRRSAADAALLAGVAIAALLATVVLGGAPMYLRSLDRVGVQGVLDELPAIGRNLVVIDRSVPTRMSELEAATAAVDSVLGEWLEGVAGAPHRTVVSSPHVRVDPGELPSWTAMRFQLVEGLDAQVTYSAGRGPAVLAEPGSPEAPLLEASIYGPLAQRLGIAPDDLVRARAAGGAGNEFTVRVSGLFTPDDAASDFWMGFARSLLEPEPISGLSGATGGFFVNGEGLARLAQESPGGRLGVTWLAPLDQERLGEMSARAIVDRMDEVQTGLERALPGAMVLTGLDIAFERFIRRARFAKIPMFLMAALLLTVVAYYLFMAAITLVERRQDEISMLRSRGVSRPQLGVLFGLEALLLIGVPALVAPFLAMAAIGQMGRVPMFHAITGGGALPVSFTWTAPVFALGAAAVAGAVLVLPAVVVGSGSVAARKRVASRPESAPFFQRYYLDVAVLAVGGLLVWELNARGGAVVSETASGGTQTNAAFFFTPVLFLLGVSLIFLRLFPPTMKLAAGLAARAGPVWATVAFWRLSRTPHRYSAAILLFLLTAGLAVVAGTLSSTLHKSARDRVSYASVSDVRLTGLGDAFRVVEEIRGVEGVAGASPVMRATGRVGTTGYGPTFNMLAVQPGAFEEIAWYRSDFSDLSLHGVMRAIAVTARPTPILLPAGATEIGAWTRMDDPISNLFLWVVLRTGDGRVRTATLGAVLAGEWRYQSAELKNLQDPVELVSLLLFEPSGGGDAATAGVVRVDDVTAAAPDADGNPARHVLVDFDERGLWTAFPTSEGFDTVFSLEQEVGGTGERPGSGVARFTIGRGTDGEIRGFYRSDARGPLPVAASRTLIERTSVVPGQPFVASIASVKTPLVVTAVVEYFPGMDPSDDSGFIVADLDGLIRYRESRRIALTGQVAEMFVGLEPERSAGTLEAIGSLLPAGAHLTERREEQQESLVDPLAVAGWRGVGLLALATTAVVGVLGYLTYLSAYSSRVRIEEAFMRALGVTRRDYVRIVAIEHLFVSAVGVAVGSVAGLAMSRIAVAASVQGAGGKVPLPPFNLTTQWAPVSVIYAALAAVVLIGVAGLVRAFTARRLYEMTRLEE